MSRASHLLQPLSESEMHFVHPDDPEHRRMWNHFPDKNMSNDEYGEVLQYMGTFPNRERTGLPGETQYYHEFRHRAVPHTHERRYWKVPASLGWEPRSDHS